jgi:outer membrane protein insertion porin family
MNQGYLEFNVESTQVSISPDKQDVYITINVTEGERYQVSSIKLAGYFSFFSPGTPYQQRLAAGET